MIAVHVKIDVDLVGNIIGGQIQPRVHIVGIKSMLFQVLFISLVLYNSIEIILFYLKNKY